MPGSATIGSNLVDSLLGMVDDLRGSLNPSMGVRQYRVYRVLRRWSGSQVGAGTATIELDSEILPQPLVAMELDGKLVPCGLEETGEIVLVEVSLTYTETELYGPSGLDPDQEFYYRITDAHGQGITTRYFTPSRPPSPDRINDIGWKVWLRKGEILEE